MEEVKSSKLIAPVPTTGAPPAAWILPSSKRTTGSPAKSQLQSAQPSLLETEFLQGETQTDASPRSLLLQPLTGLVFNPWLGRMLETWRLHQGCEGAGSFSQMLSAPGLNWTLEAKISQKRGREVGKRAQQRPWLDAGNDSAFLGWCCTSGSCSNARGLPARKIQSWV